MSEDNENASVYFVDRHATTEYRDKVAFIESETGKSISFLDFALEAGRMVDLYARHDIREEDRIGMLVLDKIDFPVIFWGSLKAGVVPVALNTLLSTDVYEYIFRDSRIKALFVSEELLPVVTPLFGKIPSLTKIFVIGDNVPQQGTSFYQEIANSEVRQSIARSADECAFWLYSSGSTGQPKGIRHAHGSLKTTANNYGSNILGIKNEDIVFSAAKLFFAYGLGNGMTFPLSVGASTILYAGRPTPDGVFNTINKYNPSIFYGVPTLYASMNAAMENMTNKIERPLRRCVSAGEALPRDVGLQWEKYTGCEILDGVGSTELLHIFLSNAPGDIEYGTSGRAVPGYDIKLVNEDGEPVNIGEVGELVVRGQSAAIEYWNMRDKSKTTFEGWWTRTGDKYEKTKSGRLVYCGRTDDMFKVSGIWVSPFEIEQALIEHPAVLEAAVVPDRDEEGLEKPKAFVVLKDANESDDLKAVLKDHVKESIGKWKYPRWIVFTEELPKTATGKIQRFKLRNT